MVDGFGVPTLQFGRDRYHRSHVLDEISGGDDGVGGLREGGDLGVRRIESVGACGTIAAGDWVKKLQHSIVQWASACVEYVDAVWWP